MNKKIILLSLTLGLVPAMSGLADTSNGTVTLVAATASAPTPQALNYGDYLGSDGYCRLYDTSGQICYTDSYPSSDFTNNVYNYSYNNSSMKGAGADCGPVYMIICMGNFHGLPVHFNLMNKSAFSAKPTPCVGTITANVTMGTYGPASVTYKYNSADACTLGAAHF